MVLKVFVSVSEDNPHTTLDEGIGLVATATGKSKASVNNVRKGMKMDGKLVMPRKTSTAKQVSDQWTLSKKGKTTKQNQPSMELVGITSQNIEVYTLIYFQYVILSINVYIHAYRYKCS
jgi:hypothetical protein